MHIYVIHTFESNVRSLVNNTPFCPRSRKEQLSDSQIVQMRLQVQQQRLKVEEERYAHS